MSKRLQITLTDKNYQSLKDLNELFFQSASKSTLINMSINIFVDYCLEKFNTSETKK